MAQLRIVCLFPLNFHGGTPLHLAVTRGHVVLLQLLIQQPNIDWDSRNNVGETVMVLAIRLDAVACMRVLHTLQPFPRLALHMAVKQNALSMVNYLAPMVAMDTLDDGGLTVLHAAVMAGQIPLLSILLQHCPQSIITQWTLMRSEHHTVRQTALGILYNLANTNLLEGTEIDKLALQHCIPPLLEHLHLKIPLPFQPIWWWQRPLHVYDGDVNHQAFSATLMTAGRYPLRLPAELWCHIFTHFRFALF